MQFGYQSFRLGNHENGRCNCRSSIRTVKEHPTGQSYTGIRYSIVYKHMIVNNQFELAIVNKHGNLSDYKIGVITS